jgi:hypothetical protein
MQSPGSTPDHHPTLIPLSEADVRSKSFDLFSLGSMKVLRFVNRSACFHTQCFLRTAKIRFDVRTV